jgi:hypothetical protein
VLCMSTTTSSCSLWVVLQVDSCLTSAPLCQVAPPPSRHCSTWSESHSVCLKAAVANMSGVLFHCCICRKPSPSDCQLVLQLTCVCQLCGRPRAHQEVGRGSGYYCRCVSLIMLGETARQCWWSCWRGARVTSSRGTGILSGPHH